MLAGDEPSDVRAAFLLDAAVTHLNHGSFGACPIEVLEVQTELRRRLERNPMQFFLREVEPLLDAARARVATFVGAADEDLAFVTNATSAVNAVLRSIDFAPGDEILTTTHGYNACQNAALYAAERAGARVVVADVPFPVRDPEEVVDAVTRGATPKTKLALVDHVTSQTAVVFPIARIVRALAERGIDTMVDGAHAPGMVDLDVAAMGAAYFTGNCHKWMCSPKGAAFLHVRRDRRDIVRPLTISHGANAHRAGRSRFFLEFDWQGTSDPTAFLAVPAALDFLERSWPGGMGALRRRNRDLALRARSALLRLVGGAAAVPAEMIGSIASVELPKGRTTVASALDAEPLAEALAHDHRIEVPVFTWGSPAKRLLRVSAHLYNRWPDYERLLERLPVALAAEPRVGSA